MSSEIEENGLGSSGSEFPQLSKGVRRALAAAAEDNADVLANRLLDLSKAEKEIWTACPSCGKRHTVRVPDSSAATNAIKVLLAEGKGKEEERQAGAPAVVNLRPYSEWSQEELLAAAASYRGPDWPERSRAAYAAVDAFVAGKGSKRELERAWRAWRVPVTKESPLEAGSPDAG